MTGTTFDLSDVFDSEADAWNIELYAHLSGLDKDGYSNEEHALTCKRIIREMHEYNTARGHDSSAIAERWLVRLTKIGAFVTCFGGILTLAALV